jgi:hypothetical protein
MLIIIKHCYKFKRLNNQIYNQFTNTSFSSIIGWISMIAIIANLYDHRNNSKYF